MILQTGIAPLSSSTFNNQCRNLQLFAFLGLLADSLLLPFLRRLPYGGWLLCCSSRLSLLTATSGSLKFDTSNQRSGYSQSLDKLVLSLLFLGTLIRLYELLHGMI